jgi:hypothetical protein
MAQHPSENKNRLTDWIILAFVVVVMVLLGLDLVGNALQLFQ